MTIISFYKLVNLFLLISTVSANGHLLEGIYCGTENCYDVLGVTRASTRSEISKNYRKLARKFHPDLHKEEEKKEAEVNFIRVATAYEILRDEGARTDYDYMLDNPDDYYSHYYRYYRRRVAPKVDVRLVIIATISIISIIQYYSAWQRYKTAIQYFMTVPKYRNKALEMIQTQETGKSNKKNKSKLSKAEQKEETEKQIRKVIEEKMDIQGAYAKPEIVDILWIQLLICPYTITMYVIWYVSWVWNFTIMRKPYGVDEKTYLIRSYMKMGQHQFNSIEEEQKQEYLQLELWIKENFVAWKEDEEEEKKKQMADNPRYKAYRRFMKNQGSGRMTFE